MTDTTSHKHQEPRQPKAMKQVWARVTQSQFEQLDAMADHIGLTMSQLIRVIFKKTLSEGLELPIAVNRPIVKSTSPQRNPRRRTFTRH